MNTHKELDTGRGTRKKVRRRKWQLSTFEKKEESVWLEYRGQRN